MKSNADKYEMRRQQVNAKIHWGSRDQEVLDWLQERHGELLPVADSHVAIPNVSAMILSHFPQDSMSRAGVVHSSLDRPAMRSRSQRSVEERHRGHKALDDEPARRIYFWDNLVVAAPSWKDGSGFYEFNADSLKAVKLSIPSLTEVTSIGVSGVVPLALGRRETKLALVQKVGEKWIDIAIPLALTKTQRAWIVPATKGIAILSSDYLYRLVDGIWNTYF